MPLVNLHWATGRAREFNITDLRWVISHVPFATKELIDRLKTSGRGVQLTGWRYLQGTDANNGSPFRLV